MLTESEIAKHDLQWGTTEAVRDVDPPSKRRVTKRVWKAHADSAASPSLASTRSWVPSSPAPAPAPEPAPRGPAVDDDSMALIAAACDARTRCVIARTGRFGRRAADAVTSWRRVAVKEFANTLVGRVETMAHEARDRIVEHLEREQCDATILKRVDWPTMCLDSTPCRVAVGALPNLVRDTLSAVRASGAGASDVDATLTHLAAIASHAVADLRVALDRAPPGDSASLVPSTQALARLTLAVVLDAPHVVERGFVDGSALAEFDEWSAVVELAGPLAPTLCIDGETFRPDAAAHEAKWRCATRMHPSYLDIGKGAETLVSVPAFSRPERRLNRSLRQLLCTQREHLGLQNYVKEPMWHTIARYCNATNVFLSCLSVKGFTFAQRYPLRYDLRRAGFGAGISALSRLVTAGADALVDTAAVGGHVRLVLSTRSTERPTMLLVPPAAAPLPGWAVRDF